MDALNKINFLKSELNLLIGKLGNNQPGKWGKMNAQQMLEHLTDFFEVSTEKMVYPMVTPQEYLPKYREFLFSDKEFRENTKAPEAILGEEPKPLRHKTMDEAKQELNKTVEDFFTFFEADPTRKTLHPVFGPLNFDEWVLLHYKHVHHHLRQFS
jgi:oxepin-CoA hydrolase/3-oxo-5,6-dehydrosuberyl-CoA semialdehyde dehydrogenase